jgi:sugar O-acyltransferase (sialic acid O-acetyltransferase NeuD family)
MGKKYSEIVAPQLGVNDESAVLIEWSCNDKEKVSKDDVVCIFESTKATFEVNSPDSGYLGILINEGETVKVNQVIGIIIFDKKEVNQIIADYRVEQGNDQIEIPITKKAKELALKHKIDIGKISSLGPMIRTHDVKKLIRAKKVESIERPKLKINERKESVVIYGAGKGGATIFETLELGDEFEVVAFIDDNLQGSFLGRPIYRNDEISTLYKKNIKRGIIAIANGKKRCLLGDTLEKSGFKLINAIHPNSYISSTVKLGKGNHIKAGAIIDTNTIIGNNNIIDNGVMIAHDNNIGEGCHLAPGCVLGSSIEINDFSILGIGSSISTKVKLGKGCIVSLNTSVVNNIADNLLVEGVPGKIIGKTNI